MQIQLKSVSDLVHDLRQMESQFVDRYVPFDQLRVVPTSYDQGETFAPGFVIPNSGAASEYARLLPQVHPQVCGQTGEGTKMALPTRYYEALNAFGTSEKAIELLCDNINFWLRQRDQETHRNGKPKNNLLRMRRGDDGRLVARGLLSDRYFAIDNIAVLTTLMQVLQNQYAFQDETVSNFADGARVFNWDLTDTRMRLCIMNPGFTFDLNAPERGVIEVVPTIEPSGHFWVKPGKVNDHWPQRNDGQMLVFPAAFLGNSETGHGGLEVRGGLYEGVCNNTASVGQDVVRRHIGQIMDDSDEARGVVEQKRKLIMAMIADAVRTVFDPAAFERRCLDFAGLFEVNLKEVRPAAEYLLKQAGISEGILDDILMSYETRQHGRNTLGDLQRAITNSAQRQDADLRADLEKLGGDLIANGVSSVKKELLLTV